MTREEALQSLNLPFDADREAVEAAYRRLVRRYPPEFHPEKFRTIDDSYRYLVSLPAMVQQLLAPTVESENWIPAFSSLIPLLLPIPLLKPHGRKFAPPSWLRLCGRLLLRLPRVPGPGRSS